MMKDAPFVWGQEQEAAFAELKERLTTAPFLAHPDYEKAFILHTDACITGLEAVLLQLDKDGKEHPIVYLSRSLSPAEANYSVIELECVAIV